MKYEKRRGGHPKGFRGSFTIEAAVVVPIAMVFLMAVIHVTLWIHDGVTMKAINTYAALDCADENSRENRLSPQEQMAAGLLIAQNISSSVSARKHGAEAVSSAAVSFPLPLLRMILGDQITSLHVDVSINNMNGRKVLLPYKALCDGAKTITDLIRKE